MSTTPLREHEWVVSNPTELGRALSRVRRLEGMNQGDMATRIGVNRSYLARMENGLSTEQVQRIFAVLREVGYELAILKKRPRG